MPLTERISDVAHAPIAHLAGGVVTLASIFVGVLVMFVAYVLAGLAGKGVTGALVRREVAHGARFALSKIVRYVVLLIGAGIALTSVGIRLDALLAASTVVLVGIGLGLQNIAQNFVSGIILLVERPVARGDFVRIGDAVGIVSDIGMRATRVITRDEVTIIVPNSQLIAAQVINHSVPTTNLRIAVNVGVAYGSDVERVRQVLLDVASADPELLPEPAHEVRFVNFGDSSLDFSLLVWISNPREDQRVASRLRFAIDAAFRAANIEIPFPQRDVHIRSAKGLSLERD
ncbi:MAG: mechanosensitive ion channel domain-containing protein [Polyangiaceae bacterium]